MSLLRFSIKRVKKTNFLIFTMFILSAIIIADTHSIYSQSFREVNFPDGSVAGFQSKIKINTDYRIYQSAPDKINFVLPAVTFVNIGIYDINSSLVRTYIYNNLPAGTYEININTANLHKGNYTCVLSSGDIRESSQVIIQ